MARAEVRAVAALLVVAAACGGEGGAPVPDAVLDRLESKIEIVELGPPERLPEFFVQAVLESGLLAPACADALDHFARVHPAELEATVARAYVTCGFTCPSRAAFAQFDALPPAGRAALIGRDCNRGGPDPLFGADEAARLRAPIETYLLVRFVLEQGRARFAADRSRRATALWRRHEALVKPLATALAPPPP